MFEDIYALPEGERAELIDGQMYYMSPLNTRHQRLVRKLTVCIDAYISAKAGNCEVFPAPFAVALSGEDNAESYVEPDITVVCDTDKITKKGCSGAPDWILEIVSPSNASYDYVTKLNLYKNAGVREYWIVDPKTRTITVYFFEGDIFAQHFTFENSIKVNIYEDFFIDFTQLYL